MLEVENGSSSIRRLLGLIGISTAQFFHTKTNPVNHAFLGLADPITRIIVLLVGSIGSFGIANLLLKIIAFIGLELPQSIPVCPLGIRVNIHLDNTSSNSRLDFFIQGTYRFFWMLVRLFLHY